MPDVIAGVLASGSIVKTLVSGGTLATAMAFLGFLMVFVGVVLPAVWSRNDDRRKAALMTLEKFVNTIRRPRGP